MLCWNCQKEIPDNAKACQYCEASMEGMPSEEETEMVTELFASLDPEMQAEIIAAAESSETAEEFVNQIMVGACPACDSVNVGDCENDPDIDNICVGRCYDCGQLWCSECGEVFKKGQTVCSHDAICDACDESEDCTLFPTDCPKIMGDE